ncbi:DUF4091 domain-containing protein [Nonomuraea phyllanthi]|uniref:DUF4091 domain-containing protein n=1 Tax=Nonomuraea phyllanthi TaxID=2219224 RepID=UPI001293B7EC|nr:DUF4091 domain-containing protein [Nonomuraea phyllanthi]QFY10367.1 DUF4091 domain-containing protein [Nonomuraea phyllanthi]
MGSVIPARRRWVVSIVFGVVTALTVAGPPAVGSASASADVTLADFEQPDALRNATLPAPDLDKVTVTRDYASAGQQGMRLDIGPYNSKAGSVFPRVWLDVGGTIPDVDWTTRTYLHVSAANGSIERARMYVVVWDKNGRYLLRSIWAEPYEHQVFEIRVADIAAAGVDLAHLDKIQISTERSPNPKRLYVDDIRLTDQQTDVAAEKQRVARTLIAAMDLSGELAKAKEAVAQMRKRIRQTPAAPDRYLVAQADQIRARLDAYGEQLPGLGDRVGDARKIWKNLIGVDWEIRRLGTLVAARSARPAAPIGLGFSDSMSHVYPRDLPCDCSFVPPMLSLVRGEYESTQLVAFNYGTPLTGAWVEAVVGGRPSGVTVEAHPVVSLNMVPPVAQKPSIPTAFRPSIYEGWTPDPIQTNDPKTDVAAGDVQAFWVTVHTTPGTKPGVHPVDLILRADGRQPERVKLRVRVWDVKIDQAPRLRTAIGHDPKAYAEPYGVTDPDEVAKLVDTEYAFLGTYMLQGDNIYRSIYEGKPPSVESLRRIDEQYGGLRQFNIWYFDPRLFDLTKPDSWASKADQLFDLIAPYVEQYRAASFADKAYLYCCDETRAEHTELIRFVLARFKQRFPDIRVLTTAIDDQMGRQSGLDAYIDWWVRDVPWYNPQIIAERHAQGREAWWYLHAGNANPTPNVFVNHDPGQLRTLLGPMAHLAGVDGFLYYRVDRWYGHPILDDGPLSNWDPRTWNAYAGDGSLLYPGPGGPIPSIRLENLRDGLEDYNLLETLHETIDGAPAGTDPALLAKARRLLGAKDVVTDNYEYVWAPTVYRDWRTDAIKVAAQLRHGGAEQ